TLYSMRRSGNCYKVRLALAQLCLRYELVEIDILKGDTYTPEFLAKNPSGHVPLLETVPGRYLPESGAILWYLADGTPLVPEDRFDRAEMLQWMFFEQHSLEPYVGTAHFLACAHQRRARTASPCHRGVDGERLSGVARDGTPPRKPSFLRCWPLHH